MKLRKSVYPDDELYKKIVEDMNKMPAKPSFNAWFTMVVKFYFENKDKING